MKKEQRDEGPKCNLTIDELANRIADPSDSLNTFAFVKAEYRETINGILPTLVATFICEMKQYPTKLREINMTLTVDNNVFRLVGNVDELKYSSNQVTLFITLINRDFYFNTTSTKFLSAQEAIKFLYPGDIESDIQSDAPVEINQVGVTDYKMLTNILRSLKSPSIFSYNMNRLRVKDTSLNTSMDYEIDFKKVNYYVEDIQTTYSLEKLSELQPEDHVVMDRNGKEETSLLEWDGMKVHYNSELKDLVNNVVSNTQEQKLKRHKLRVIFQLMPEPQCGDTLEIHIKDSSITNWMVVERIGFIGSEVKFGLLLTEI